MIITLDLNKHMDFFNPHDFDQTIHLIGAGAVGSNVANQLVRLGFTNIIIYDFDIINSHNITNQMYNNSDIGKLKVEALKEHLLAINPNLSLIINKKGWDENTALNGIVITTVDSIELRKQIVENNLYNLNIEALVDIRIGLEEGQAYFAKWSEETDRNRILSTMQFKDDEVEVPVSACGTQMTVLPTVQGIVSLAVMNLINYLKTSNYNYLTVIDTITGKANSQ